MVKQWARAKWRARVRETARMRGATERTRQQGQGRQDKNESTTAQCAILCTVLSCPRPEGGRGLNGEGGRGHVVPSLSRDWCCRCCPQAHGVVGVVGRG